MFHSLDKIIIIFTRATLLLRRILPLNMRGYPFLGHDKIKPNPSFLAMDLFNRKVKFLNNVLRRRSSSTQVLSERRKTYPVCLLTHIPSLICIRGGIIYIIHLIWCDSSLCSILITPKSGGLSSSSTPCKHVKLMDASEYVK